MLYLSNVHYAIRCINTLQRFERYRVALGLDKKDDAVRVSTLIYCMRREAEDISSLRLPEEDKMKYKPVIDSFESHFVPHRTLFIKELVLTNARKSKAKLVLAPNSISLSCRVLSAWRLERGDDSGSTRGRPFGR